MGRSYLGLVLSIALLTLLASSCTEGHPSDRMLRQRFFSHRVEFERLHGMARSESGFGRIAPEFFDETTGITEARWNEYRALFATLGLERGISIGRDEVLFIASAAGMFLAGSSKGYVYTEAERKPLHSDLDQKPAGSQAEVASYATLDGHWYLFFEWGD